MTLTQIEYVLAVHKYRHFGKAAQACFVTQPTLSMQLSKLEEELGVIIFDRTKSPIVPTAVGQKMIRQMKIVAAEQRKVFDIVKGGDDGLSGDFRLAVIPTLSAYIVPLFAEELVKKYPKIHLIIEERKTEEILSLLAEDEIDGGLLVTPLHDDTLVEQVLYYEPFYLFISPNHDFLHKKRVREEDLDIDELWLLNKGNCFRDQVLRICEERKRQKVVDPIEFESGNLETLKNMVLRGSGYTVLPYLAIERLATREKKLIRPFAPPVPSREVSLVYRRSVLKREINEVLVEQIKASIPMELRNLDKKAMEVVEIFPSAD